MEMHGMNAERLGWPPRSDDALHAMKVVETDITIQAPREQVYAIATNASRWHEWHPATKSVESVPRRPLLQGETVVETIHAAGRRFQTTWIVVAADAPALWVIVTDGPEGVARIAYRLLPGPTRGSTRFMRRMEFRSRRWPWRLADALVGRWVLARQSAAALRNLKAVVESQPLT